ncbi:hypothetical protein [Streptomyces sp. NBC_00271]|uniref:hypothetical protein n=1 Tax=Streptomyces sp. NBC_00271 TaxID=2975697 RepID=UPI002E29EBAD|nr:hypothetical protein [Streptomyces sp. NBC_00271]
MACSTGNPLVDAVKGFFQFLGDPIGSIVEGIANSVLGAAISVFGTLTTGIPTLSTSDTAQDVDNQTQWIVVYTAVASLIFAAIRMALERRGEAGATALKGLLRVIVVAGGATAVVTALAGLSDRYADFLFKQGASQQLTSNIGCQSGGGVDAFLLLVLAFLLLIAGIVHTILLYIRLGVMILLLGTLPLAAAASMTNWGSGWWRKHIGWMVAWLLYKPAAGLVLFAGSAMISSGPDDDIHERIAGIGVMFLSAVALPALLKLVVPATAALGGANVVGKGVSTVGSAVATGARSLGAGSAGAGQNGTAGGRGPSGATGAAGAATNGSGAGGRQRAGGGRGTSGAGALAAGPAGAVVRVAQNVGNLAAGALDGADGNAGHNR